MSNYKDRPRESATTTGTGDFSLAGAETGFVTFNTAYGTQRMVNYVIEAVDANKNPTGDWESGEGYLSASTTLVRRFPREGSGSLPINFAAGTKMVFSTMIGKSTVDRGIAHAICAGLAMP